jgi:hypothetical protein
MRSRLRTAAFAALLTMSVGAAAALPPDPAAALLAQHTVLRDRLERSSLPQHLYVESFDRPDASGGDVYGIVDYPIALVSEALSDPAHWCDVLILHLNVKYCHPVPRDGRTVLSVALGRKVEQPLTSTFRVDFDYRAAASRPDYLDVALNADQGPLGTGNYRISFSAVGVTTTQSFVHLRYSYTQETAARTAMKLYLATTGRGKQGFTVIGAPDGARPEFVGGPRGAIERNTMRYYLAIDSYLGTRAVPERERVVRSMERWFDATERYPEQLHEIERAAYLDMKHSEYRRQQTLQ